MDEGLTARQQQVLDFINYSISERGYPPTLREIGRHLKIRSTNGVNDHLKALERKGFLKREDLKSRGLHPTSGSDVAAVPVVGTVAAGSPLLAVENIDETIRVDRSLLGRGDSVFALRVKGESMIEDGIYDGDYVFVRKQPQANAGDTVVAMIEGEATVKRFYPENGHIRLQPANAAMDPIIIDSSHEGAATAILGLVVGVYRRL